MTRYLRKIAVSDVGMGCMGFSHGYGTVPDHDEAVDSIRAAYQAGCTFFDTAEGYGKERFFPGHNEQLVGEAVHPFRDQVVLATKVRIEPEEVAEYGVEGALRHHLALSMENLQTDYVDLYYLHRVNEDVALSDVSLAMGKLIDQGLIRGWGLSQVSLDLLKEADQVTPVSAVQNLYNMLERDCEQTIQPYCLENGIGLVPFSPITSGFLSGQLHSTSQFEKVDDVRNWVPQLSQENMDKNQPVIHLLNQFAEAKGVTTAQLSLAWMLAKYPNVVPIPGSKNRARILENLAAAQVDLAPVEMQRLDTALNELTIHGHRGTVEVENRQVGYNRATHTKWTN